MSLLGKLLGLKETSLLKAEISVDESLNYRAPRNTGH